MEKVDQIHMINQQFSDVQETLSEKRLDHRNVTKTVAKLGEDRSFYDTIDECPQCKQEVGSDHRSHILGVVEHEIQLSRNKIESLEVEITFLKSQYEIWEKNLSEIEGYNKEISVLNRSLANNNATVKAKKQAIDKINSDTSSIDEDKKVLRDFARSIIALSKQKQKLTESLHYLSAEQALLQDTGIKAKIIKQYIPIINKLVNKYLDELDFFCQFTLTENFEEEVKSRHRDTFRYESFSEGQKARIDMALMFAWRDVARLKNSVNCNLIWMDEIMDSSVDSPGADLLLELLSRQKNTNTFIISHRDGIADKFDQVLNISLKNNFTLLE
jgi:DNA repair exonuclease SbcCD ATPase subunit